MIQQASKSEPSIDPRADRAMANARGASSALTPAQLAAALAVVRHHADRMQQRRRSGGEGPARER